MNDLAASAATWAEGSSRIAVLTGAGISTDSGIPDYRGPNGVWTRDPAAAEVVTYSRFMADPAVRVRFWRMYHNHPAWTASPNAAHRALATLDGDGRAVRILTQNIDGLHQMGGSPTRKVLELHGSMHEVVCTGCGARTPSAATLARVGAGDEDPACLDCGGILKLAVVLFEEYLETGTLHQAGKIAKACHLLLVIGTSLRVEPAAGLCAVAVGAGARLVIVNRDPTPYDRLADEIIREPIAVAVPQLVAALVGSRPAGR